jgi:hypothetical protein
MTAMTVASAQRRPAGLAAQLQRAWWRKNELKKRVIDTQKKPLVEAAFYILIRDLKVQCWRGSSGCYGLI